jgi:hypothetical protein
MIQRLLLLALSALLLAGCENNGTLVPPASSVPKWTQTIGPNSAIVNTFAAGGAYLFAGVGDGILRSADNGANWNYVIQGVSVNAIAVTGNGAGGVNLFAGTSPGGILESNNDGSRWYSANYGLTDHHILALAANGSLLVAATSGEGVFVSTNDGVSWNATENGLPSSKVDAIAFSYNLESVHQSAGLNIFLGTLGSGVYYSNDTGGTWTPANADLADSVTSLAVINSNIFAGTLGQGIFTSTDNGASWTAGNLLNYGRYPIVHAIAVEGTRVFAAVTQVPGGGGAFYSTDNGATWSPFGTGLPNSGAQSLSISDSTLFAGSLQTIWRYPL